MRTKFEPGIVAAAWAEHRGDERLAVQRCLSLRGRELRIEDNWQPASSDFSFRPWLRLVLMARIEDVNDISFERHSLSLKLWLPQGEGAQAFRLLMSVKNPREVRWYVGESFASEEYGRTVPAVEVIAAGEDATGAWG